MELYGREQCLSIEPLVMLDDTNNSGNCCSTGLATPSSSYYCNQEYVQMDAKGMVLAEYCNPDEAPMIPDVVLYCIKEIEDRGISYEGIYLLAGTAGLVQELTNAFLDGIGTPDLSEMSIHVVSGCLKYFLRSLVEPLLTFNLRDVLIKAAINPDTILSDCETDAALNKLPRANLDTLAYLMLHLHSIAQNTECKMSPYSLSRVFGPILVGYSSPDLDPHDKIQESSDQMAVMGKFFEASEEYWFNKIRIYFQ